MSNETEAKSPSAGKSNWRPIGLTLLGAVLLGAGSCFGAIASGGNSMTIVFSVIFIACALAFVVGLIWALIEFAKSS
jgi:hypothetical protein